MLVSVYFIILIKSSFYVDVGFIVLLLLLLVAIIMYWAIWMAAEDMVGLASNDDISGLLNIDDMADWSELWEALDGVKDESIASRLTGDAEVDVILLVVLELDMLVLELVLLEVWTCMGKKLIEEGPTMVALARDKAAAKAPIIPVIWLFIFAVELKGTIVIVGYGNWPRGRTDDPEPRANGIIVQ